MCSRLEAWRECADWLTRCGILRSDHKANWAEAKLVDLACTLRDGVLLCNLLNLIEPGCIDMKDVNQKPRLAQVCFDPLFHFKTLGHCFFMYCIVLSGAFDILLCIQIKYHFNHATLSTLPQLHN